MATISVENPPSFTPVSSLLSSHRFSYIKRIHILHDGEGAHIPQAVRNPDAAQKMYESTVLVVLEALFGEEIARKLDSYAFNVKWKLFLRHKSNNVHHPSRQLLEAFRCFDVEYIDPGERPGAVDMKIFSAVDDFIQHPDYQCAVVLIGGDRDFSASLSKLRTLITTPQPIVTILLHNGEAGELNRALATVDCPRWLDIVGVGLDYSSAQASSSSYELLQQQVAKRGRDEDYLTQEEDGGERRDHDYAFNQGGQSVGIPPPQQPQQESSSFAAANIAASSPGYAPPAIVTPVTPLLSSHRFSYITRILILHDAENCYIPQAVRNPDAAIKMYESTVIVVLEAIFGKEIARKLDSYAFKVKWKLFLRHKSNNVHHPSRQLLEAFQDFNVEHIDPGEKAGAVDMKIFSAVDDFLQHPDYQCAVVLIGGDRDFSASLSKLRTLNTTPQPIVIVLLHNGQARPSIRKLATVDCPRWLDIVRVGLDYCSAQASSSSYELLQQQVAKRAQNEDYLTQDEGGGGGGWGGGGRREDDDSNQGGQSVAIPPAQQPQESGTAIIGSNKGNLPISNVNNNANSKSVIDNPIPKNDATITPADLVSRSSDKNNNIPINFNPNSSPFQTTDQKIASTPQASQSNQQILTQAAALVSNTASVQYSQQQYPQQQFQLAYQQQEFQQQQHQQQYFPQQQRFQQYPQQQPFPQQLPSSSFPQPQAPHNYLREPPPRPTGGLLLPPQNATYPQYVRLPYEQAAPYTHPLAGPRPYSPAEAGATLPSTAALTGPETTDVSPPSSSSSDPQLQQLQQLALPGTVVKRVSTPFVRFLERFHTDTVRAEVEQDGIYCRMVVGKGKWSVYLAKDKFREPTSKEIANAEDSLTRLLGSIVMTDAIEIEGVTLSEIRQDGRLKELEEQYQVYVFSFEAMVSADEPTTTIENDNRSAIDSSSSSVPPPVLGDIPPSSSVVVPPQSVASSSSSTAKNEIFMKGIPMKWQFEDIRQFVRSRYNITIMSGRFFETSGLENATYRLAQLRLQPSDTYGRNKLLRAGQVWQLGHPIPITFEAVKKSSNAAAATNSGDLSLNGPSPSIAVAASSTLPPPSSGVKSDQAVKKVVKVNVIFRKNKLFPELKQEQEAQEAQEPQETQEGEKDKPEVSEAAPSPPPMDYNNPPEGTGPYLVLQYLRSLSRRSIVVNVTVEAWQIWIGAVWPDLVREMWDKFHVTLSIGSDKMAASMNKKPATASAVVKTSSSTSESVEGGGPLSGRTASANSAAEILPKIDKIGMEGHADNLARAKEALFEYLETEIVHKTLDPPSTTKLSSALVKAMRNLRQETKRTFVRELAASEEMKAQGEQVVSMLESNDVDHEKRSDAVMAVAERVMSDESFALVINQTFGERLRRGLVSLLENGDDFEKSNAALAIANFALKDPSFVQAINAEHGDRLRKMLVELLNCGNIETRSNAAVAIGALSEKLDHHSLSTPRTSNQEGNQVASETIRHLNIPSPPQPVVIHVVTAVEAPTAKGQKSKILSVAVIVVSAKRDQTRFEEIAAKFEDLLEKFVPFDEDTVTVVSSSGSVVSGDSGSVIGGDNVGGGSGSVAAASERGGNKPALSTVHENRVVSSSSVSSGASAAVNVQDKTNERAGGSVDSKETEETVPMGGKKDIGFLPPPVSNVVGSGKDQKQEQPSGSSSDQLSVDRTVQRFGDERLNMADSSIGGDGQTISILAEQFADFPFVIRMSPAEEIAVCQGLGLPPPSSNTLQTIDSVKIERSVSVAKRFAVSFAAGADEPPMLSLEVAKADWRSICVDGAVRGCLPGRLAVELESFLNEGEAAMYVGPKTSHAVIAESDLLSSCFGISKVICAAPPKLVAGNDHRNQEEMKTTIKSILDVANEKGLESISLSMIGDVLGGDWTHLVCAELFVSAIREWVVEMSYIGSSSVKQIVFVDSRDAAARNVSYALTKAMKSEVVPDLAIVSMQAMSEKPVDWKLDGSREDVSSLLQRIQTYRKLMRAV